MFYKDLTRAKQLAPVAADAFGVTLERIMEYGGYGAVFELEGDDERILKVTSDRREAQITKSIMNMRKKGKILPAFPIYYDFHDHDGSWFFILREKVDCPCLLRWEDVEPFQFIAFGGKEDMAARRKAYKLFPHIAHTLRYMRKRGLLLADIRTANVGHTLKTNKYRSAGDLVVFDFH